MPSETRASDSAVGRMAPAACSSAISMAERPSRSSGAAASDTASLKKPPRSEPTTHGPSDSEVLTAASPRSRVSERLEAAAEERASAARDAPKARSTVYASATEKEKAQRLKVRHAPVVLDGVS